MPARVAMGTSVMSEHSMLDRPPCATVVSRSTRAPSKGGTTHAAISSLEADGVKAAFVKALRAAQQRARELGEQI